MALKIRQNGFMTTERALHLLFTVFRNAHLTTMQFLLKSFDEKSVSCYNEIFQNHPNLWNTSHIVTRR